MQDILIRVGLNEYEAALYLSLLRQPRQTAQKLAEATAIGRTNAYRLLEALDRYGLVVVEDTPVRVYSAADPKVLAGLLSQRQTELRQTASALSASMAALSSQYALSLDKPGIFHLAGDDGFERLLSDMAHSRTDVLLIASNEVPQNPDVLARFRELQAERKANGVRTRALFHSTEDDRAVKRTFAGRGIDVRFTATHPYTGEIALYEDNVAFTVYVPSLVTTVISNASVATTMKAVFEELWKTAAP